MHLYNERGKIKSTRPVKIFLKFFENIKYELHITMNLSQSYQKLINKY